MEWQEGEEPDRVRKRKRKTNMRSRRQNGVFTNIPPERKGSTNKTGSKYLLVGVPKTRVYSDDLRMAALDLRIEKTALILEEKFKSIKTNL